MLRILEAIEIEETFRLKNIALMPRASIENINSMSLEIAEYENILGIEIDREALLAEEEAEAAKVWDELKARRTGNG